MTDDVRGVHQEQPLFDNAFGKKKQAACVAVVDGSVQLEAVALQAQNYVVTGTYKAVRCVTTQRLRGLLGLVVTLSNVFGCCCTS
jgi:hypothetical protein